MENIDTMELVKRYNIPETSLRRALKKEMTKGEAIQYCLNNKKKIRVVSYKNLSLNIYEIERLEGILPNSLYNYNKTHPEVKLESAITYLQDIQSEKRTKNDHSQGYLFIDETGNETIMTVAEIAKVSKCSKSAIYRKLAKNMTIEEAITSIKENTPKYYIYKGEPCTIKTISRKTKIPKNYLYRVCEEESFEENMDYYFQLYQKKIILTKGNISLYEYCILEKYNYNTIYKLIINKGLSVDQAIEYYKIYGARPPHNWIYEYSNILLNALCLKYKLDINYIRTNIKDGLSIQEAMEKCCFCSHSPFSIQQTVKHLSIYNLLSKIETDERYEIFTKLIPEKKEREYFDQQYNKVSIINRDLLLIELYREYTTADYEKKEELIKKFKLSERDKKYMDEDLLADFIPVAEVFYSSSKELTKCGTLYYNKPKSKERE